MADVGVMMRVLGIGALLLGALAIVLITLSSAMAFGILLAVLAVLAAIGAAFFRALRAAAIGVGDSFGGEPVLTYGVGRGGKGFLGAHVLVVTDGGVQSAPAHPWSLGAPGETLRFADVEHLHTGGDSLSVEGAGTKLLLKKCPPAQVVALENAIRDRLS